MEEVRAQDHPRGCGENIVEVLFEPKSEGSPPRMRGKRPPPPAFGIAQRITPADAGKTVLSSCCAPRRVDHPRGCGENVRISP